jgi:transposase
METLTLTTWQRRRLERQLRDTHDARVYRRTLAVLEVAQGEAAPCVARRLRVTPRVVYYWIEAYLQGHAPDALRDRDRSGRPHRLTQQERTRLLELLGQSPQDLGYFATEWTVGLLQEHLARYTGPHLSEDTLRRELHRLDYTCKRPRYALDPDPELRGKKAADSSAHQGVAAARRRAGGGRDRPAAVPAFAGGLVATGPGQAGSAQRPQRPQDGLRGAEPAHGTAAVPAARASAGG